MVERRFRFLDHTADLKFIAFGKTLNELFVNCAIGMFSAILENSLSEISPKISKKIELNAENIETLLHDFLSELLFYFETYELIPSKFDINITKGNEEYLLNSKVYGEKFNSKKHKIVTEIKAITYHDFYVKETKDGWEAQILCDI